MKQVTTWFLTLLLAASSVFAEEKDNTKTTGDDKTDGQMVKLQKKAKGLKTCKATISTTIRIEDQEVTVEGKGLFKGPGKMRVEESMPDGGGQVVLSDGSYLWIHDLSENMVTRINLGRVYQITQLEADVHQFDPLRPFRGVTWESIRYAGQEVSDGETLETFDATPQPSILFAQLPTPPAKVKLAIHPGDGLLRTARLYDADGNEMIVQAFSNVQGNRELEDKRFEFVVPAGAHPMDATNETIGLFQLLQ
tara:strand:- start:29 stop:781 length:753 start_codon:yes stop_codon:yes gene_type:complete